MSRIYFWGFLILISPKGKYVSTNGSMYEGEWKNDKQHGQGLNEITIDWDR